MQKLLPKDDNDEESSSDSGSEGPDGDYVPKQSQMNVNDYKE